MVETEETSSVPSSSSSPFTEAHLTQDWRKAHHHTDPGTGRLLFPSVFLSVQEQAGEQAQTGQQSYKADYSGSALTWAGAGARAEAGEEELHDKKGEVVGIKTKKEAKKAIMELDKTPPPAPTKPGRQIQGGKAGVIPTIE